jgi:hypothetical protein
MLLFLSIAGLVSIIPLSVWAATGRLNRAFEALAQYLFVMACIVVPVLVLVAITYIPLLWS